jgi:hypothetical protein
MFTNILQHSSHLFTNKLKPQQIAPDFNVWLIVLSAVFFFLVLSIYNFVLSVYNYMIGNNLNNVDNYNKINKFNMFAAFGYILVWLIVTISMYSILFKLQLMG